MDETPDRAPLPLGMREWHVFKNMFNDMFDDVKFALRPAKEEVVRLLTAGVSVCHFTCHGETNYDEPAESMLLMKDWQENPLTVSEIQSLDVKPALLASLSACFTANAGVEYLQDEIIHLTSALQVAGFVNVFGSLWYVGEQAALQVIEEFYHQLATVGMQRSARQNSPSLLSPDQIAKAIHFAILKFRETTRHAANSGKGNPVAWAPFVHYGA
jgi:CHAT domain-containing protein